MNLSHTEQEMLQAKEICENFDFEITKQIANEIGDKRIIFTGMGSSLMFPGKHAKNRALKLNVKNKIEAYFASDLFQYDDFSGSTVFVCSNSGKTKECVLLMEHLQKSKANYIAVTAVEDSVLAQRSEKRIILKGGFEEGVAATKSVVEQALIYDSLIFHLAKMQGKEVDFGVLKASLVEAGNYIENNINVDVDNALLEKLEKFDQYYFVGLDNGVAEEMTLKCYEIVRKRAFFFPDTHIVHGVVEAINGGCAVVFGPENFTSYISDFQNFQKTTGCELIGVGESSFMEGIQIKANETFKDYCLLAGGWGLLRNIAKSLKLDMDHPVRATKVGNPFEG